MDGGSVNEHIFRTNSIRGIYGEDLHEDVFKRVGRAFASSCDAETIVVGADHRLSSPALKEALIEGLLAAGRNVMDAGTAPKGLGIYAARRLNAPLAYVSASHLPKEWNGLKFIHPTGRTFNQEECRHVYDAFFAESDQTGRHDGKRSAENLQREYTDYLLAALDRPPVPLKILLDHGNGTSALLADELLRRLGFEVTSMHGELDGRMPNRSSELTPEALQKACCMMNGHDLGLAFDGDADRVAFIAPGGLIIDPERFALVIVRKLMRTRPGPIVANVACGKNIADIAARFGQKIFRVPVGTPNMIGKALEEGACFGMEISSHMIIPSLVPYDDACAVGAYAAVALSEAVAEGLSLEKLMAEVPECPRKRIPMEVPDKIKAEVMEWLEKRFRKAGEELEVVDGLRVSRREGWVLIRASNTEPALRLVVEAESDEGLAALEREFLSLIKEVVGAVGGM